MLLTEERPQVLREYRTTADEAAAVGAAAVSAARARHENR